MSDKDIKWQKFNRLTVIGDPKIIRKKSGNKMRKRVYWFCECECGTQKYVEEYSLMHGLVKSCGCYAREMSAKTAKVMGMNEKIDLVDKKIGLLTVLRDTGKRRKGNGDVIWECKCDCGNIVEKSTSLLRNRNKKTPISCGCMTTALFKRDIKDQKFFWLTALYPTEKRSRTSIVWHCRCKCGNEVDVGLDKLVRGETRSCGCLKSFGEEIIAEILNEHGYHYEREKKFDDCRFPDTNCMAKFDFYVNDEYIIECDGEQHKKMVASSWFNGLDYIKAHDQIKNNWCFQKGITIIRIPYSRNMEISFDDLKPDTSSYVLR